ncbi:MAG TPA: hypothetical protein VGM36_11465 [Rhizomicrobium sp.]
MQNFRNHLHFIWADKIALWLAILFVAMAVLGWILVAAAAGVMGADHVVASLGLNGTPIVIAWVSVWALLRAIDFIAKGSTYRLFVTEPAPAAAATPTVAPAPAVSPGKPMAAI